MEIELKKVEANSSNNTDTSGNGHSVTIHKLEKELKKVKEELAESKEKLGISRVSNLNRLVEVATHRERVRDLEGDLEEVRVFIVFWSDFRFWAPSHVSPCLWFCLFCNSWKRN